MVKFSDLRNNAFCGYGAFKLFIPGLDMVQFLINNAKAFDLRGEYSVFDNEKFQFPLKGYWEKKSFLEVKAYSMKNLGPGIEIKGHFQNFAKESREDCFFKWPNFLESIKGIQAIIPFEPERAHIINLEVSLNLGIPSEWDVCANSIISNILRYKGQYNYRQDKDQLDGGYSLEFALTEYDINIKDKDMEGVPEYSTIAFGIKTKKSSFLKDRGIPFLSDLLEFKNHLAFLKLLKDLFNHLIIYQNEADNELLLLEEHIYCREFNKPQQWNTIHKQDPHKYKYLKKKLEAVIEHKCRVSYKKAFQEMIDKTILESEAVVVPEFLLYMEKPGQVVIFPTTVPGSRATG